MFDVIIAALRRIGDVEVNRNIFLTVTFASFDVIDKPHRTAPLLAFTDKQKLALASGTVWI
jgi:hypothetical protein